LDLNGFNQTLVGIQNLINNGTPANVINRGTAPSTLTLTPVDPTVTPGSANLVFTAGGAGTGTNAVISDNNGGGGTLSIFTNGAANGVQTFNVPNSNYHGSTTLMSGILSVNSIANGGANSSIGASDNTAGNLVFSGGTLRYTGGSTSTDRNFTATNGT